MQLIGSVYFNDQGSVCGNGDTVVLSCEREKG